MAPFDLLSSDVVLDDAESGGRVVGECLYDEERGEQVLTVDVVQHRHDLLLAVLLLPGEVC